MLLLSSDHMKRYPVRLGSGVVTVVETGCSVGDEVRYDVNEANEAV